ncbi:MAG: ABC transporter substrate-binding protein [Pseudomonadales bacterium]
MGRIQAEVRRPSGDVWFDGSLGAHAQGAYEGLLEAYRPVGYEQLLPPFRDPLGAGRVTGLYTGILGFVVNSDALKEKGLPVLSRWQDLLDPRYRVPVANACPTWSPLGLITEEL